MSSRLDGIIARDKEFLYQNNGRLPVCFTHGKGEFLYDTDGREYVDLFSGIAVSALGHAHPALTARIHAQVDRIIHSSNWYYNAEQIDAAEKISNLAFKGKTFFSNSGTEANEAALKLARKYGKTISSTKNTIISFTGSFHGRTYGAMSVTGNDHIREGFDPLLPAIKILPFNDIEEFRKNMNDDVCGVILEVIQGEGGIIVADKDFMKALSDECKKHKALLIIDEIQTGIGRTGKAFGYQNYDIIPDVITMAKGLAGGVPIGAMHTRDDLHPLFNSGAHGTTFGGNQLAVAAACATLDEIAKPELMAHVKQISEIFFERFNEIKAKAPVIKEVRGLGLHIGIELGKPGMDIVKKALAAGLLINCTHGTVIRIMPPLILSEKAALKGLEIFESIVTKE
jgi:acetylornithine/N-succinyldiaminopimelate aminotransferase